VVESGVLYQGRAKRGAGLEARDRLMGQTGNRGWTKMDFLQEGIKVEIDAAYVCNNIY
jgi:hypothetical protein